MTTTSVSSEPLSSNYLSSYTSSTSFHSFPRRQSIYGTEDRVVLDIGSLYIKCGFSGESHPRHVVSTCSRLQQSMGREGESYRMDDEVKLPLIRSLYSIYLNDNCIACRTL
ncbi:hypothetical protein K492DRAFT_77445 [Lichtheimia hyalospora FSU 10163]|nr:hypothetical protein K492DRAFT_77445 [Lichtheimia hyalospora FSU 10163]